MINPEIISILSVGHSGSTLLDVMLGQFKYTFSTGELKHLTWQFFRELNSWDSTQKCTCGESFSNCHIWGNVFLEIAEELRIRKEEIPADFSIKYFEHLEYNNQSLFHRIWKKVYRENIQSNIIPDFLYSTILKNTDDNNVLLYNTISKISNKRFIIDSSKDLIRFNQLRNKLPYFPIVLIRYIDEIIQSKHVKSSNKKAITSHWLRYYNNYVYPLISKMPDSDYVIVGYETLVNEPQKILARIAKKLNFESENIRLNINMKDTHLVAGNPMRYADNIELILSKLDKDQYVRKITDSKLNNIYKKSLLDYL